MTEEQESLTPQEQELFNKMMGSPVMDEKHNIHTFLNNVAKSEDTTKTGYLDKDEVGLAQNPIRVYKEAALFADDIMHNKGLADYFKRESEIVTSTSLSKDAMLLRLAITSQRHIADVSKQKKENKGMFKSKDKTPEVTNPLQ